MNETTEQTDNPPTEEELDVEAPNESAPGHNPDDGEPADDEG